MGKSRSHKAFIVYYEDHKDKIFNYLMHRLNANRSLCDDLFMEIFLRAYEKFHYFDPKKGSFNSWIFRIAHNHLVNYWRREKQVSSLEDIQESKLPATKAGVEEGVKNHFNEKIIKSILPHLSQIHQEMITLRYFSDLSYKEMAQVTGKKEGTIRSNISRALAQFKTIYYQLYEKGI